MDRGQVTYSHRQETGACKRQESKISESGVNKDLSGSKLYARDGKVEQS